MEHNNVTLINDILPFPEVLNCTKRNKGYCIMNDKIMADKYSFYRRRYNLKRHAGKSIKQTHKVKVRAFPGVDVDHMHNINPRIDSNDSLHKYLMSNYATEEGIIKFEKYANLLSSSIKTIS